MKYSIGDSRIDRQIATESALTSLEVTEEELPEFLFKPDEINCGPWWWWWLNFAQLFLHLPFNWVLRPRDVQLGQLDPEEVKHVYDREAKWYDWKHHLTTFWNDSAWRRRAAQFIVDLTSNFAGRFTVLDICSGTGLTAKEIAKGTAMAGQKQCQVAITGIDFNQEMLQEALKRSMPKGVRVDFCLADATNMVCSNGQTPNGSLCRFDENTFDASTLMCGIGGIKHSAMAFEQILRLLKPGSRLWLSDMHVPIFDWHDSRPFWQRALELPNFAKTTWYNATVPDALGVLWGWKDPTLDFYLVPFATYQDGAGECWGFKLIKREFRIDPWWLRMPLAPVCEVIVEKEAITAGEMKRRQQVLVLINPIG